MARASTSSAARARSCPASDRALDAASSGDTFCRPPPPRPAPRMTRDRRRAHDSGISRRRARHRARCRALPRRARARVRGRGALPRWRRLPSRSSTTSARPRVARRSRERHLDARGGATHRHRTTGSRRAPWPLSRLGVRRTTTSEVRASDWRFSARQRRVSFSRAPGAVMLRRAMSTAVRPSTRG